MKITHLPFLLLAVLFCLPNCSSKRPAQVAGEQATASAYIGTYTRDEGWVNGQGEGIYEIEVAVESGKLLEHRLIKKMTNPSFVVESADERYLYAVSELAAGNERTGFIHAFDVKNNYQELSKFSSGGRAPCHIELDQKEAFLLTSNYLEGVCTMFRRNADGSLVPTDKFVVSKEEANGRDPHLHSSQVSPDNTIVAIADLGLDRVWLFNLDEEKGKLIPRPQRFVELAKGAGPRHMEWSANGDVLYVINELNSTANVLKKDQSSGTFSILQTISTLPEGWNETNSCADIHLHPSGKFLYGSNRGHNSIVVFAVDAASSRITTIGHTSTEGDIPRNFTIAPSGQFLYVANQNSSNITAFSLNEKSGQLTYLNQSYSIGTPVCIEF